jgi:lactobin A/cerein 7B family class IIb bacteriocin
MNEQRMKEIFSDEAFVKELFAMETPAQVQAALKEKGIDITETEVIRAKDLINERIQSGAAPERVSEELSLEQLDDVAGGALPALIGILIWVVVGVVAGGVVGGVAQGVSKIRW